jgi:hypothetical protein
LRLLVNRYVGWLLRTRNHSQTLRALRAGSFVVVWGSKRDIQ